MKFNYHVTPGEESLTTDQVARHYTVSTIAVLRWTRGRLETGRTVGGCRRMNRSAVAELHQSDSILLPANFSERMFRTRLGMKGDGNVQANVVFLGS